MQKILPILIFQKKINNHLYICPNYLDILLKGDINHMGSVIGIMSLKDHNTVCPDIVTEFEHV